MARRTLTDGEKATIEALHAAGNGRNEIMRQTGLSARLVTDHIKDKGLSFDRTATRAATAARLADFKAERLELAARFLDTARYFDHQARLPQITYIQTKNDEMVPIAMPASLRDGREAIVAATTAMKMHLDIVDTIGDASVESARSMLDKLTEQVEAVVAGEAAAEAAAQPEQPPA